MNLNIPSIRALGLNGRPAVTHLLRAEAVAIANNAEKLFTAKVVSNAVFDLLQAAHSAPKPLVRIMAQLLPWPDHKKRPSRSGLTLKWRCLTEEGVVLVESTDHPLTDSAAVLSVVHGMAHDTMVTLRHTDKGYDSFRPMKLAAAAAHGIKRLVDRTRLAKLQKDKAA